MARTCTIRWQAGYLGRQCDNYFAVKDLVSELFNNRRDITSQRTFEKGEPDVNPIDRGPRPSFHLT